MILLSKTYRLAPARIDTFTTRKCSPMQQQFSGRRQFTLLYRARIEHDAGTLAPKANDIPTVDGQDRSKHYREHRASHRSRSWNIGRNTGRLVDTHTARSVVRCRTYLNTQTTRLATLEPTMHLVSKPSLLAPHINV